MQSQGARSTGPVIGIPGINFRLFNRTCLSRGPGAVSRRDPSRWIFQLIACLIMTAAGIFTGLNCNAQPGSGGSLVIVGGGLEADNKTVFQEMITRAGGAGKAVLAVIPSAGGAPVQSYAWFRSELMIYGVDAANIHLIPIAMVDDDSTKEVNESEWKSNGNNDELAGLVRKCTGVWFTGGDQLRTVRTLYNLDGSPTGVLKAVWDVYRRGGMIGGTSAGAAIMSEVMIGAGTSLAALSHGIVTRFDGDDFPEDSGVLVVRGLGFFPHGVVDQHFNERARVGRLAVVLAEQATGGLNEFAEGRNSEMPDRLDQKSISVMGFGIDENTAMIYDSRKNRMIVAGTGGVTILSTKDAGITRTGEMIIARDLTVSYLEDGDSYDFNMKTVIPGQGKQPVRGKERNTTPFLSQYGPLAPNPDSFRDLYTTWLIDNKSNDYIQTITSNGPDSGFLITLRKTNDSEGYLPAMPGSRKRCSVKDIRMDITPVLLQPMPIKTP